jgi:DNA-binding HxlR family transcriptional regulator
LVRGEFAISGFTNEDLRQHLPGKKSGQVTRLLKRLRMHGLIKKVGKRYKYYLTEFGRQVAAMALKLREMVVIPELAWGAQPKIFAFCARI